MKCSNPTMSFIIRGDLEPIFKKAKAAGTQLLFFVVKSRYNYHQQIKALEQKYDVLTQEIRAETAEKVFRQPQTRLNIINKTNMKLGGLNYAIGSEAFNKPNRLIVGFVTSQRVGGNPDVSHVLQLHNHISFFPVSNISWICCKYAQASSKVCWWIRVCSSR